MLLVFIISISLVVYTYFIYILILILLNKLKKLSSRNIKNKQSKGNNFYPTVTIIIAAYNEEKVIEEKTKNCLELKYNPKKLEVLIGSDGSTDATNDIIKKYVSDKIKLIELPRRGKTNILNELVPIARGEIIVFSDANTIYKTDAIKQLVKSFSDEKIGCVCGKLKLLDRSKNSTKGESLYWKYELFIKKMESLNHSVIGSNGGIYAIRKELYCEIPANTLADDFFVTCKILEKGYECAFAEHALAFEEVAVDTASEFKRKVRIAKGNFQNLFKLKKLLLPSMGFVAFSYWSHKVLRWFVPIFLILAFISNIFLFEYNIFKIIFIIQTLFYILAFIGYILDKNNIKNKTTYICYYFVFTNIALLVGLIGYIKGIETAIWERTER